MVAARGDSRVASGRWQSARSVRHGAIRGLRQKRVRLQALASGLRVWTAA
ncbi:type II toxin-antitoxin system ParD family antitoxin [Burkholderia sp. WSM2232]